MNYMLTNFLYLYCLTVLMFIVCIIILQWRSNAKVDACYKEWYTIYKDAYKNIQKNSVSSDDWDYEVITHRKKVCKLEDEHYDLVHQLELTHRAQLVKLNEKIEELQSTQYRCVSCRVRDLNTGG